MEDESSDDEAKENSNDAIADVIEICVGRVPLKDAVEESECDLQPSVTDPFASGRDPASDGSGTRASVVSNAMKTQVINAVWIPDQSIAS